MQKRKYLIVVDMQNDFVDGSLGTKEAQAIVPRVREIVKQKREEGYFIVFTQDTHYANYLQTNEGKHLPVEHCIYGTHGWEIVDGLFDATRYQNRAIGDVGVQKNTFGCDAWPIVLGDTGFGIDVEEIELIGLCTDICVVSNALILKALYPEATIKVDSTACAGVKPETHEAALTTMRMCQIEVL